MAIITEVANALFKKNEKLWGKISLEDKETYTFILNRLLSKKYPAISFKLNLKSQDKSIVLDMWFQFMKTQPYPNWLWSKSPKVSATTLDNKDFKMLMKKLNLNKEEDLIYLIENQYDIIEEELKYYKKKEKI